ncbi:MAG: hypothetical protein AAGU02_04770, partial [Lawsonibacter sp.]
HPSPIDLKLSEQLRQAGERRPLDTEAIEKLLAPSGKPKAVRNVPARKFWKFFPKQTPVTAIERTMLAALAQYFDGGGQILTE